LGVFSFWPDPGNQPYWGISDQIFSDNWFKGLESGITDFNGGKNRPLYSLLAGGSFLRWAGGSGMGKMGFLLPGFWDPCPGDTFGS
jgi:hypothetical protein